MKAPYLQIALDNESLEDAFHTLRGGLGNEVDIIEVGTMLILMEGVRPASPTRLWWPTPRCPWRISGPRSWLREPSL